MMEELRKEVLSNVKNELGRSNQMFSQFLSLHEGYAVLLEELEETSDAVNECDTQAKHLWIDIKANETDYAMNTVAKLRAAAINAACEAIQCAAMCDKFITLSKVAKQKPIKTKKHHELTPQEKEFDTACRWAATNIPEKKQPCYRPDGKPDNVTDEHCMECVQKMKEASEAEQ